MEGAETAAALLASLGNAVGIVAYMPPGQARGEDVDVRSGLFSLGVVLYEMATGRQTFTGSKTVVIFDAILRKDPVPPAHLHGGLPQQVENIIR